ncbi:MFS transporter [Actinoplanes awajinensis]|uniref:MFS transporter n=1 Tax=Actinoplanes awajinensis subsp. mycoplanecinus TaxID=135947 RepID=A0A101JL75_9ACTN|nr:MFS transporter [Actinoplanes awajinensis]KUL28817.1 MFS transporter [Actinoplanes awajinensis subsp. mycoplanecinus]
MTTTYRDVFAVGQFRVLFAGYTLFLIGETVRMLALSVTVYAATGSPLLSALAYAAGFLPYALGGALLLSFADRWPPRPVLVGYDLLRAAVSAVLAAGILPVPAMLALVVVTGLPSAVTAAARTALLPDLLAGDGYVLGRAVFAMTAGGTQVLGFATGGVLITAVGARGALAITAATCLTSAALLRRHLADHPRRRTSSTVNSAAVSTGSVSGSGAGTGVRSDVGVGVGETWRVNRSLLGRPAVRSLLLAHWLAPALAVGAEGVLIPYAARTGAPDAAGLLFAAVAAGMFGGHLIVGRLALPAARERLAGPLALALGMPLLAFALQPAPGYAAVLLAVSGAGVAYQLGLAGRFLDAVPADQRGQAFGLLLTGTMTLQGLAAAAGGALGEVAAPGLVIAAAGAASATAALLSWRTLTPRRSAPSWPC